MSSMRSKVPSDQRKTRLMRRRERATKHQRRRRIASALEILESRYLLAFTTDLFADINQFGVSSLPDSLIEFNSELYFVAEDGRTGSELWKSDGTEIGTVRVADINPGPDGSLPSDLTVFGSDLFFTALDGDGEFDLWKTDGTTVGTVRVFDADAVGVYELANLTASGSKLFFTAYESSTGYELWASDGTSAGTALVRDINSDQLVSDGPQELTDVNGKLFFSSYSNGYDNRELWESDGTLVGTVMVADIDSDPLGSSIPHNLTNINGTLFFAADDSNDGVELYTSTGSAGATVQVADLNSGSSSSYPENLTLFDGQLFYTADDGSGIQLFKSDGATITLVANTTPGATGSSAPAELTVVGTDLFFAANGGQVPGPIAANQPELTTDNSFRAASTHYAGIVVLTTALDRGSIGTATTIASSFVPREQTGAASDGPGWVSQTARIGDLNVGLSNVDVGDFVLQDVDPSEVASAAWEWTISDAQGLSGIDFSGFASGNEFDETNEGLLFELFLNGSLVRTSFTEVTGDDLDNWFAGRNANNISLLNAGGPAITSATVRMTFGINGGPTVFPNDFNESLVINASLTALGASSGTAGRELHMTDGTTTSLVKDIVVSGTSDPSELTEVNGQLFFTANDPAGSGRELWASDGTEPGTALVRDIRVGFDLYGSPLSSDPQQLIEFNGQLLFTAVDDLNDRELWTSGGSFATTNQLKNVNVGTLDANIQQIVEVGSKIFFVADDGINGEAVWMADPAAGTVVIAADVTGSSNDRVNGLAKFGSGVIFHNDSLGVYTTDGTTTTPITPLTPIAVDVNNTLFVQAGAQAYFVINEAATGEELWKTDGTTAGIVVDLFDGDTGSEPRSLVEFDGQIYFSAEQVDNLFIGFPGREVFRSNGTAVGTTLLRDLNFDEDPQNPGGVVTLSSDPEELTVSGARLYFSADAGINAGNDGRELWSTDGTFNGTTLVSNIRPGSNGSDPTNLTDVGGVLYFSANDGSIGFEPYKSDGTAAGTVQLSDINPGSAGSNPSGFMQAGANVYFAATQGTTGTELWVTDGTLAGTAIVDDLLVGIQSSDPLPLGEIDAGRLIFAASGTGPNDRELWITGGPISGLLQAADMNPGPFFGSNPTDLIQIGTDRLFVGDDGLAGNEFYRLEEFAPQVESLVIDDGSGQRSSIGQVTVTFDSIVQITGDPFDFQNLTSLQAVADVPVVSTENGKTVVNFTFTAGASVNSAGLLLNGDYQLTIDASSVSSLGTPLDGDGNGTPGDDYVFGALATDDFYRKYGDENGNRVVDLLDFAELRKTFGASDGDSNWNHAFDNDGDGTVGLLDFAEFRRNFGT